LRLAMQGVLAMIAPDRRKGETIVREQEGK
jgi:hypothetical protein